MDYKKKVKYIKKKSKRWSFQYGKHKRLNKMDKMKSKAELEQNKMDKKKNKAELKQK